MKVWISLITKILLKDMEYFLEELGNAFNL